MRSAQTKHSLGRPETSPVVDERSEPRKQCKDSGVARVGAPLFVAVHCVASGSLQLVAKSSSTKSGRTKCMGACVQRGGDVEGRSRFGLQLKTSDRVPGTAVLRSSVHETDVSPLAPEAAPIVVWLCCLPSDVEDVVGRWNLRLEGGGCQSSVDSGWGGSTNRQENRASIPVWGQTPSPMGMGGDTLF